MVATAQGAPKARDKIELATARFQESVADVIPTTAIDRALSAKDFYGFIAAIFASTPVSNPADDRLKEQQFNAARFKRDMAERAGGLLEVAAVRESLGHRTRQAVYKAAREHRLLAVDDGGQLRFPACQFVDGAPVRGLKEVLTAAPATSGWRMLQYLLVPEEGLAGRRPLDLLRSGSPEELEIAIRFARRLED